MKSRVLTSSIVMGFLLTGSAALFGQGKSDAGMRPDEPQVAVHWSRGAAPPASVGGIKLLNWNGGPVMHGITTVTPIFWGPKWGQASFVLDQITGLKAFYAGVGDTLYARTNSEYTDNGPGSNASALVALGNSPIDLTATPKSAPSTSAVFAEVCKVAASQPGGIIPNGYYPVYSDIRRGTAGYCAWHSAGMCSNGAQVTFGFFFDLAGDSGCSVTGGATGGVAHSEGLASVANVSGHELSEMITDPKLNAWYDRQGYENSDKCAWTFGSNLLTFNDNSTWKIQGNWSNAAYNANIGYASSTGTKYRGCIDGDNAKLP